MQCLLRSQISLKPGGCSRLSPDSASRGEGKGWVLLEETVTSCLRKEVPCLALVRESQSKRYEGKYLPSVLAKNPRKLQVTFFWPRIVLLSTFPVCFSENKAKSQSLLLPAPMSELQSQCIDLFCISIHMTDTDRHDLCPGAGGMNKKIWWRGLKRGIQRANGWQEHSSCHLCFQHPNIWGLCFCFIITDFFFKVIIYSHISACIFYFLDLI